jgi:hypothetical protein
MKPSRYFVRIWHMSEDDSPDEESRMHASDEAEARLLARVQRAKGANAGAFERTNIRVPDDVPMADPPEHFWEYDEVQLDEDDVTREIHEDVVLDPKALEEELRVMRRRSSAARNVRDGRIDRIDDKGNIREHRVRADDASLTLCGLVIFYSQPPCGNGPCRRCASIARKT